MMGEYNAVLNASVSFKSLKQQRQGFMRTLKKTQIKQTALLLALVYFFLSSYMTIGVERHALEHQHHANHAARHASFICAWMCGASTFVHSTDQDLDQSFRLSFASLPGFIERFVRNLTIFSFHIRPPPISLL